MNKAERHALDAANRIRPTRAQLQLRFWICGMCGWKTISERQVRKCERCESVMQPDRSIYAKGQTV